MQSGTAADVISRRGTMGIGKFSIFAYLFLATASHGVLDAMTNGGLGIAFFSPINNRRFSFHGANPSVAHFDSHERVEPLFT